MIKITLLLVGKTTPDYLEKGINDYATRIKRHTNFEIKIIKGIKSTKSMSPKLIKKKEGEQILNSLKPNDYLIILDDKGKEYSSLKFSKTIENKSITGLVQREVENYIRREKLYV